MDPDFHFDRLPALAVDLVRLKPDLIVAFMPAAVRAAKNATSDIPIVMLFVADPVGMGLVPSLANPGGNLPPNLVFSSIFLNCAMPPNFQAPLPRPRPVARRLCIFCPPVRHPARPGARSRAACGLAVVFPFSPFRTRGWIVCLWAGHS